MRFDAVYPNFIFFAIFVLLYGFNLNVSADLGFQEHGSGYQFDTGALKGELRKGGQSFGLAPVTDIKSGAQIAASLGLLTPYRLLDSERRYLPDVREWRSTAELLADGAVQVNWTADENHPFDLQIVYRWATAEALDATVTVSAKKLLPKFEVFMTCYFSGFNLCHGSGSQGLVAADRKLGDWLCFPRDNEARKIIADGRWKHEPNPVDFIPVENYKYPFGVRASLDNGLTSIMLAAPQDCFAVLMPHHEDNHYSLYLSLFGYDIKSGHSATARCRVVISRDISEKKAVELYQRAFGSGAK
ncbi:MAG: hypothetical protein PHO37_08990 [Kiritimatiellae bacterium]|nr:hypothetical protein [Kiritimatiellia bacterium]